jgi:DegV family protein with EDD domain
MVAVVADSAANLPEELARELGIEVVPMYLKFGDRVYRDGIDLTPADFYDRLVLDGEPASTSVPSPGDFLEAYQRTGQEEIVCITVASSMSSSRQQAMFAAERFDGRVEVVDSMTASMAEGFVAAEAARLAAQGGSVESVVERARSVAARTRLLATVGTFEFLRRSGRVTKLQAYAATMLDIKPVFAFKDGEIAAVARTRTRRRAIERIEEDTVADAADRPAHLAVIHAAAEEEARSLLDRLSERIPLIERVIAPATPVIGAHTGPGLVGTAFFCDEGLEGRRPPDRG